MSDREDDAARLLQGIVNRAESIGGCDNDSLCTMCREQVRVIKVHAMTLEAQLTRLTEQLQQETRIVADMRRASAAVDEAKGGIEYNARLVALALMARQFLRELPLPPETEGPT